MIWIGVLLVGAIVFGIVWGIRGDRPKNPNEIDSLRSMILLDVAGDIVETVVDRLTDD
jgi:hypothetical protein